MQSLKVLSDLGTNFTDLCPQKIPELLNYAGNIRQEIF